MLNPYAYNYPLENKSLTKCHELLTSIKEALTSENLSLLQPNLPYITAMLQNAYLSIDSVLSSATTSSDDEDISDFQQTFSVAPARNMKNN